MNPTIIVTRRVDGRLMPATWPHTPPEVTQRLVDVAHHLHCGSHLSYRRTQAVMLERYGLRRSLGQLWKDIQRNECPYCIPEAAPPPKPRARPVPWR
jgi:hypothetical protein